MPKIIAIGSTVKVIDLNEIGQVIKIRFDDNKNPIYTLRVDEEVSNNGVLVCGMDEIELLA